MKPSTLTLECQRCHKQRTVTLPHLKKKGPECPFCGARASTLAGSYTRPSNIALST